MKERLRRWWRGRRPVLRPGEEITFYDPSGLIPRATLIVEEYTETLNRPSTMRLVSKDAYLEARLYGKPAKGETRGFPW